MSRFATHTNVIPEDQEKAYFRQVQMLPQTDDILRQLLHKAYDKHPVCKDMLDKLRDGQYHPRFNLHHDFIVTREIPFRLLIPDDKKLRASLFKEIHDTPLAGHPGFHKFIADVLRHFVGPHLRRDVLDFTRTYPQCQIAKPRNNLPYSIILPLQPPKEPWQDISIDLIIYLPNSQTCNAIFVVIDCFSKMAYFIPTQT